MKMRTNRRKSVKAAEGCGSGVGFDSKMWDLRRNKNTHKSVLNPFRIHSPTMITNIITSSYRYVYSLVLSLLFLHSNYVQCLQPRLNSTEMDVLKTLYDSTGGSLGMWNYTGIAECINYNYHYWEFIGRQWNFTKNATGAFLEDPCPNTATSTMPFMGVNCTCSPTSCSINALTISCGNLFGSIPSQIFQLTHLKYLDLGKNLLKGSMPSELGNLVQLQVVDLSHNRLTGSMPSELGNLVQLQYLVLSFNGLIGSMPSELGNLVQLQILVLDNNRLTGSMPSELGNLVQLQVVDLKSNGLTGSMPSELGNLVQLHFLWLDSNRLTGSMPSELGNLVQLQYLYLANNKLTGEIPKKLSQLTQLQNLHLNNNSLTGSIPEEITQLKYNLSDLDMSHNKLSGSISPSFGNMSLEKLLLSHNMLTGSIPSIDDKGKGSFTELDLSYNSLTSSIPSSLGTLGNLKLLFLTRNLLTGPLPASFSKLSSIEMLLLHGNHLANADESNALNFIDTTVHLNLKTLDISGNAFVGSIAQSVFELPMLQLFAAGSNCFSGSLPSNICKATMLNTLSISSLTSGIACRNYVWNGTIFQDLFSFDGFIANYFMEGEFPQCVYELPNLKILQIAANEFRGNLPLRITDSLVKVDVSSNLLTGSISSAFATKIIGGSNLTSLYMSFNRIGGDLSAFSDIAIDESLSSQRTLELKVNHLSGYIPNSLLQGNAKITNIVAGNEFSCKADRSDLPYNDVNVQNYQCGSTNMNTNLYAFAALVFLFSIAVIFRFYRILNFPEIYFVMQLWLSVADGRHFKDAVSSAHYTVEDHRALLDLVVNNKEIVNTRRIVEYLRNLRQLALKIGVVLTVVLIIYLSLSGSKSRVVEFPGSWTTTAAYLTGLQSTICLLLVGLGLMSLTWVWIRNTTDSAVFIQVVHKTDPTKVHDPYCSLKWLRKRLLPFMRIVILIVFIWGAVLGGNILYLNILLTGSVDTQNRFKLFFAAFKLVWTMQVTPYLFENKSLYFGVEEKHHKKIIKILFGSKLKMMLILNSISTFWIPLFTASVVDEDCFHGYFIAADPSKLTYTYDQCVWDSLLATNCTSTSVKFTVQTLKPFSYNYSCSSAILRAYVPLFQQSFMMLIGLSILQVLYYTWDFRNNESITEQNEHVGGCLSKIQRYIGLAVFQIMPFKHLLQSSSQRKLTFNESEKRIFTNVPHEWILQIVPKQIGNLLLLLTFGVLAPPLGITAIASIVLDTYVSQMAVGKFLARELAVVMEHRRLQHLGTDSKDVVSSSAVEILVSRAKLLHLRKDIEDANQPWGALAVLQEVESQCLQIPASTLNSARWVLVVFPSIVIAFVINDVQNGVVGFEKPTYWAIILIFCVPLSLELFGYCSKMYYFHTKKSSGNNSNFELTNISKLTTTHADASVRASAGAGAGAGACTAAVDVDIDANAVDQSFTVTMNPINGASTNEHKL